MSTRSIIVVTDGTETTRLYRHSDGYPTAVLPDLALALARTKEQFHKERDRYPGAEKPVNTEQVVGHVIGAMTSCYGMGARIDDEYDPKLKQGRPATWSDSFPIDQCFGNQGDLEWIYLVDLRHERVMVYGGGYTGHAPLEVVKKGIVDPLSYVKCLRESAWTAERLAIEKAISDLKTLGYAIN